MSDNTSENLGEAASHSSEIPSGISSEPNPTTNNTGMKPMDTAGQGRASGVDETGAGSDREKPSPNSASNGSEASNRTIDTNSNNLQQTSDVQDNKSNVTTPTSTSAPTSTTSSNAQAPPQLATSSRHPQDAAAAIGICIEYWKTVNLDQRRVEIDKQALSMYDETDRATSARKQLAEVTKSLKSKSDAEKLSSISNVLKSYQVEINELTRRSKFAEFSFLTLYKQLFEAPDPVPFLVHARDAIIREGEAQKQIRLLEDKIKAYDIEFSSLKNQDVTLRKLQDEVKYLNDKLRGQQDKFNASKQDQLNSQLEVARQQMIDMEYAAEQRCNAVKDQLTLALRNNDTLSQQVLELQSRLDNRDALNDHSNVSLASEIESKDSTIEQLRRQLSQARQQQHHQVGSSNRSKDDDGSAKHTFDARMKEMSNENNQLRQQLSSADEQLRLSQNQMRDMQLKHKHDLATLQQQLDGSKKQAEVYKQELQRLPSTESYNHLTSQLAILQEIAYGNAANVENQLNTAEQLLLKKSHKYESELTQCRQRVEELEAANEKHSTELTALHNRTQQQSKLLKQLEDDLAHANAELARSANSHHKGNTVDRSRSKVTQPTPTPLESLLSSTGNEEAEDDGFAEDDSDIVAMPMAKQQPSPSTSIIPGGPPQEWQPQASSGMMSIIIGQRDRFRERMELFERENGSLKRTIEKLNTEVNTVKADNLALYNKLQFVRSYANNKQTYGRQSSSHNAQHTSTPSSSDHDDMDADMEAGHGRMNTADTERKYKQLHDQQHNPFDEFNKRAKHERIKHLPAAERWTLTAARILTSRKSLRMFIFFYAVILHLLVFIVIYTHTLSDHCGHGVHTEAVTLGQLEKFASPLHSNANSPPNAE